ncbi:MAG TPA: RagB/SusD family nutrient uptake outer membrane protein [Saprospiraceae bacterium]|nr:RagB/SusD family nutrient uptake outer membrane protein [Saprospiraceae bacterium]
MIKSINKIFFLILVLVGMWLTPSCNIEELDNPNGASISGIVDGASKSELQLLVTGTESLMRKEVGYYYDVCGIIGREYWFFTNSDPRYTGELLGKNDAVLDNRGFYGTRPYAGRYKTVKNTNILMEATRNSKAILTPAQKSGYYGFAKTIQAYELLLALNLQYTNGIRIDVSNENHLGDFVDYDGALMAIQDLLAEGANDLASAGDEFAFTLSSGFEGFDTPAAFAKFNHALAARVALYQGDMGAVNTHLLASFMDMSGDFDKGVYRPFSTAGGEVTNPVYRSPGQTEALIAHPAWVADIEPNDDRINKVLPRDTLTLDNLTGTYDVAVYSGPSASIPIIRNEELILMAAEANIGTSNPAAKDMINVIRTAHGLPDFTGTTDAELLDEVIKQRRYSLFAEGHRWVDMRRWGRLDQLPEDRENDDVWEKFPRPGSEN